MALIIEDGTGITGAEAYADAAAFATFEVAYYGAASTGTDAEKEASIRRTIAFMDALPWRGVRTNGYDQALSWPQSGMIDENGFTIPDNVIPADIIKAQHLLARAEHATAGTLSPSGSLAGIRKRVKVDTIEVEYAVGQEPRADSGRVMVTSAMDLLRKYLKVGAMEKMGLTEYSRKWGIAAV